MKNHVLKTLLVVVIGVLISCEQNPVNPSQKLDEVFIPQGYVQDENPSTVIQSRVEELRLNNPQEEYFYLQREKPRVLHSKKEWLFSQKELLIKYVDYDENDQNKENPILKGVIVKKIKGDPRNEVFTIIDQQPKPIEGMKQFYAFISENLKYPAKAKELGIEGKVFLEFVVNNQGKLTKIKAIKGIGGGCDEEAVRVLKEAPNWIPGKVVDINVGVRMILPITYNL